MEFYHHTADIHTLNTIRNLDEVFLRDDLSRHIKFRECLHDSTTPTLLYLVLLLHDIGKSKGIMGMHRLGLRCQAPF